MAMKENAKKVMTYLRESGRNDLIAADVAEALDLEKRSVDGIFTGFQRKGYGIRVPSEIELEDGRHKAVNLLQLTEAGMTVDIESPDA